MIHECRCDRRRLRKGQFVVPIRRQEVVWFATLSALAVGPDLKIALGEKEHLVIASLENATLKMTHCWMLGMLVGCCSLLNAATVTAQGLSAEKFQQLHEQLQPSAEEIWRTIPWRIDLVDAQRESVNEDKPIFIWAMDGHPLGCT